jgi:hypothetical protein
LRGAVSGFTRFASAAISILGLRTTGTGLGAGFGLSRFATFTGCGGFTTGTGFGFGWLFATTGSGFTGFGGSGSTTAGGGSSIGTGFGSLQTMSWVLERSIRSRIAVKRMTATIMAPSITPVLAPPSSSGPIDRHPSSIVSSWAGWR